MSALKHGDISTAPWLFPSKSFPVCHSAFVLPLNSPEHLKPLYLAQNHWIFGHCSLPGILITRNHDVSEVSSPSVLMWSMGEVINYVWPLRKRELFFVPHFVCQHSKGTDGCSRAQVFTHTEVSSRQVNTPGDAVSCGLRSALSQAGTWEQSRTRRVCSVSQSTPETKFKNKKFREELVIHLPSIWGGPHRKWKKKK
jgi:hypothetical protein